MKFLSEFVNPAKHLVRRYSSKKEQSDIEANKQFSPHGHTDR